MKKEIPACKHNSHLQKGLVLFSVGCSICLYELRHMLDGNRGNKTVLIRRFACFEHYQLLLHGRWLGLKTTHLLLSLLMNEA